MKRFVVDTTIIVAMPLVAPDSVPDTGSQALSRKREIASRDILLDCIFGRGEWMLTHNPDGSPSLSVNGSQIYSSISHSRSHICIAFDKNRAIGVDIENPTARLSRLAAAFINGSEVDEWGREERLLKAWCAKEAAFKLFGGATTGVLGTRLGVYDEKTKAYSPTGECDVCFMEYDGASIALAY